MDDENQSNLKSRLLRYYQFAYCLISDDLQAAQLVIDSWAKMKSLKKISKASTVNEDEFLLLTILELGRSRVDHSFPDPDEGKQEAFFKLSLETRVVLWANYRMGFSCRQVSAWFEKEEFECYNQLLLGERRLLREAEGEFLDKSLFQSSKLCPQSSAILRRMSAGGIGPELIQHLEICDNCQAVNSLYRKKESLILDRLPVIRFEDDLRAHMEFEMGHYDEGSDATSEASAWGRIGQFFSKFAGGKKTKSFLSNRE